MTKRIGSSVKSQIAESNVWMFTTLFQGQKEGKTTLKTLWDYAVTITTKSTLEQN